MRVVTEVNKAGVLVTRITLHLEGTNIFNASVKDLLIYAVNVNPSLSWISKHTRSDS